MLRSPSCVALATFSLVLAGASFASTARADSASVLAVRESPRVPENVRNAAELAAVAALVQDGVAVRSSADTEAVLTGDPLAECAAIECAGAVAQRVGADFVVVLSVFGTAEQAASVTVALATADGLSFGGEADITREVPLAQAVTAAIAEARVRQGAGTRGTLRVETTPPGATVHIDGRFRGETPLYRALEPGPHQVVVRAADRVTETHDVIITLHGESALRLTLAPVPPPAPARTRTVRPVLGPLLVGVAGLALLAADGVALASTGCTEQSTGGVCARETSVDALPFALYAGVGGAALVSAVLWFVLGAHDVVDASEPTSASLRLDVGVGELGVSGRF
jgi:hypothetical protein